MNVPLDEWNGSDATKELTAKIVELDQATKRQSVIMLRLTWAIAVMTFMMTIGVGIQIYAVLN